ncbi:MAG: starch-binding protein [Bacteroidaceae bacterium]|nr:starch-binding protein [Bacteroidaceae bacterium]
MKKNKVNETAVPKEGNAGWPAQYGGVMLQGFYWDSWNETSWAKLTEQADELSRSFELIWVPNSGTITSYEPEELTAQSSGYDPLYWFKHNSIWGSEAQLREMIKTFKKKGTGIIEDVVINHKKGEHSWCDFATEKWKGHTIKWTSDDICATDEAAREGFVVTGKADEGDDFDGFRDLNHASLNVQKNVKVYLQFLLKDLGYTGFRYDMVKGYAGYYVGMYNDSSQPRFSVGEYWDDKDAIVNWLRETGRYISENPESPDNTQFTPQSAAFDFGLKTIINNAFKGNFKPKALKDKSIAGWPGMSRWAVTFVDNHDTYRESGTKMDNDHHVLAANALILTLPGTPCIFYPHWTAHKDALRHMIAARKLVGITNESPITLQRGACRGKAYRIRVDGTRGALLLHLGPSSTRNLEGFCSVWHGDEDNHDFALYITLDCYLAVSKNERTVYFEAPADWGEDIHCYAWRGKKEYTQAWPGNKMERVYTTAMGNAIYKWTYRGKAERLPHKLIFNNNNGEQTANFTYKNRGYYKADGRKFDVLTKE